MNSAVNNERRNSSDRRRAARGGRRPDDPHGFAPLVLVADDNPDRSARCEAILAKLRFAVAPAASVDEAVRVMRAVRPNLIVAHLKEEKSLRRQMASDPSVATVPVLTVTADTADPAMLVEEIRRVLRELPRDDE